MGEIRIPLSPGFHAQPGETPGHLHDIYTTVSPLGGNRRVHVGTLSKAAVEAWAYLTPHPYADGPIVLTPSKMRTAVAVLRAHLTAAQQAVADYETMNADKHRLARLIDVAMHGEEGAAQQPSLCDLVGSAADLRARATAAEDKLKDREAEIERLKIAFHDAIRRPLGVTPDSGAEFYDPRMADEAETRRAASNRSRHRYRPNRKYPWFCEDCGYPEHEVLKHLQLGEAPR